MLEQVDQHQRPLAFEQITRDLFAVAVLVAGEIQQIVLNLKGGAQVVAEAIEAIEVHACRAVAISAPIRQGWMKLYQQVFFKTIRR